MSVYVCVYVSVFYFSISYPNSKHKMTYLNNEVFGL